MKDAANKLKQLKQNYSREQASKVRASFKSFLQRREKAFQTNLTEIARNNYCTSEERPCDSADCVSCRFRFRKTEPVERAMLFLKVMDDINNFELRQQIREQRR